jgi:hypothetical protein
MPRPARLNLPDIPQHVTQRGNNRQTCFFSDDDYRLYLKLLAASCHRHTCELHVFGIDVARMQSWQDGIRGKRFKVFPGFRCASSGLHVH